MFVLFFFSHKWEDRDIFSRRALSIFLMVNLLSCIKKVTDYIKRFLIWDGYYKLAVMLAPDEHCLIWFLQQSCEMGVVIILLMRKLMLKLGGLVSSRTEPETQYCLIQVHGLIQYDSLIFLTLSMKNNFPFSLPSCEFLR